ncbi:hypothetical protein [uncultured Brevundimonas sp.]|mgnify:CR=1 FL=1|uniref:hypothetical protein n=1 Tax=uncultured Brevundimonas sp. TaxID=213418 RepID=UPI0030EF233D|tara:strand:- start:1783 stop:2484 length:702 start_codon:yes stop_codon:yes gene_type:complete
MTPSGKSTRSRGGIGMRWLVLTVLAAPMLVFVAVMGTRFGLWSVEIGRDLLTLQIGRWLALAGLAAAVLAVVLALRDLRRRGLMAIVSLLIALATVGLFVRQQAQLTVPAPLDATTAPADAPGFSAETAGLRAALNAPDSPAACPDLTAVPTQVASETATAALEAAGFTVQKAGLFQSEGLHEGFWFGLRHDAVVRIRPGRTDVRVTARDGRAQGDAACRLAHRIVDGLQPGR